MKHFIAAVKQAGGSGAIVNVASVSAVIAQHRFVPYSTSKGVHCG